MSQEDRARKRVDGWITLAISLLLLFCCGLVLFSWTYVEQRTHEVLLQRLEQGLGRSETGLDAYVRGINERHGLEAAFVHMHDSLDLDVLLDRWRVLMDADWTLLEVHLAQENGEELALFRGDSAWTVQRIVAGRDDLIGLAWEFDHRGENAERTDTLPGLSLDPRRRSWYSLALNNRRADPAWNVPRNSVTDTAVIVHVAQLIRPVAAGLPLRVLQFTLAPERSGTAALGGRTAPDIMNILLFGSGRPLVQAAIGSQAATFTVLQEALTAWKGTRRNISFPIQVDGTTYLCHFKPYALNGETVFLGGILALEQERQMRAAEHIVLLAGTLLLILALLLAWMYRRKRIDLRRLREQQKRMRTQQKKLSKALEERDVLDREVHHRVKNNLQVVSSLLSLQMRRLDEGPVKAEFMRGKRRIDNMALVHHKLYGLTDLRGIDLQIFFEELGRAIAVLHHPHSSHISSEVRATGLKADPDTAIALGLILCELLTNCYQHAFPYSTGGHIDVELVHRETDLHRLVVKDNGRGMLPTAEGVQGHLGLEITEALAGQLDGTFKAHTNGGVTFEVLFRMGPIDVTAHHSPGL